MPTLVTLIATLVSASFLTATFSPAMPTTRPAMPEIVAHRGASYDAPENTMLAFKLGLEQGADAIEGDFHLTADGQIVCSHDPTLKRCGKLDGKIVEMTFDEVRAVDVGSWKDPKFAAERPPTLAEVLALVPAGKKFLIEVKTGPEIVPELIRTIDASKVPLEQLRLITFDAEVIAAAKKLRPELKAYWLTSFKAREGETLKRPTQDEVLATLARVQADGLDAKADFDVLTPSFVQALRDAGHEFHAWTVDDPEVAFRLRALGVDSITTNRPGFLRDVMNFQN